MIQAKDFTNLDEFLSHSFPCHSCPKVIPRSCIDPVMNISVLRNQLLRIVYFKEVSLFESKLNIIWQQTFRHPRTTYFMNFPWLQKIIQLFSSIEFSYEIGNFNSYCSFVGRCQTYLNLDKTILTLNAAINLKFNPQVRRCLFYVQSCYQD